MPQPIILSQLLVIVVLIGTTSGEVTPFQADILPDLRHLNDDNYILLRPITYSSSSGRTQKYSITVPRGFVTDLASIPWGVQPFVPKTDSHSSPAILHDYLYWEQACSPEESDALFQLELEDAQVGCFRRWLIDVGLGIGGENAWDENKEKREQGYIKIIPENNIPCDPGKPCDTNIRWGGFQQRLYNEGVRRTLPPINQTSPSYCAAGNLAEDKTE